MIGGEDDAVARLDPIFATLAPGRRRRSPRTPGATGDPTPAEQGYLHCGPNGAGHFVKMVHNGIEYGLMAAYAEGLNVLHNADVGLRQREQDAETTPLRHPELYQYELNLADVAEVWRRGSVIGSWLLDLTAQAFVHDPAAGAVRRTGVRLGRGPLDASIAAIDEGVPAHVLTLALFERFSSRGEADFADQVLSAMRFGFGGHLEKPREWRCSARTRSVLLRRHRRPGLQADLPGAGGPGRQGQAGPARHRRGQARLGRSTSSTAAGARAASPRTAPSTKRRSRGSSRSCATSTATTTTRPRSTSCASSSGGAQRPLHYLAIPPALFDTVAEGLAASGCAEDARIVVEKPFGRDLASARELNATLHRYFPEDRDLPHRPLPGQGAGAEPALLPLRQHLPRAHLEPRPTSTTCRSRWPRTSASPAAARFYEETGAIRDVVQNHLLQVRRPADDGAADAARSRGGARRAGRRCCGSMRPAVRRATWSAASSSATATSAGVAADSTSRRSPPAPLHRRLALGRGARSSSGPGSACR